MTDDPLDFDPLDEDQALPEPSELVQQALIAAATADYQRYQAEREQTAQLGPRAHKKHQRKAFFDALRNGASRQAAQAQAGIPTSLYNDWCRRPKFVAAVERAELSAMRDPGDFRW